jgi:hypothetical protein
MSVTPIRPNESTLTARDVASRKYGIPLDIDTATIAIDQSLAILDLLVTLAELSHAQLPETHPETLGQALYAAKAEVERAREALFGSVSREAPACDA